MRTLLSSVGTMFIAFVLAGCPQGAGIPCDGPGDCSAGFRCIDGTCQEASGGSRRVDAGKGDAGIALCETADGRFQFLHNPDDQLNCPPSTFLISAGPSNVGISHNGHGWRVLPSKSLAAEATVRIQEPQGFDGAEVSRYAIWHRASPSDAWTRQETTFGDRYFATVSSTSGDYLLGRQGEALPDAGGSLDFDGGTGDSGSFDGGLADIRLTLPDIPFPDLGNDDAGIFDAGAPLDIGGGDSGVADVSDPDMALLDSGVPDLRPDATTKDLGPDTGPPPAIWYQNCSDRQCTGELQCIETYDFVLDPPQFCTSTCSYASDCPAGACCQQLPGEEEGLCRAEGECPRLEENMRPTVRPCEAHEDCPRAGGCFFNACHPGPIPVEDGEAEHDPAEPGAACRSPLDCAPVEGRQATCIHRTFDGAAVGDMSWYLDSMPQNSQNFCTWFCDNDEDCAQLEGMTCMDASRHPELPEDYPGRVCGPGERWAPVEQGEIGDACDQNDPAACGQDRFCSRSMRNANVWYCSRSCAEDQGVCGDGNCCVTLQRGGPCEAADDCMNDQWECVNGTCEDPGSRFCAVAADCQ